MTPNNYLQQVQPILNKINQLNRKNIEIAAYKAQLAPLLNQLHRLDKTFIESEYQAVIQGQMLFSRHGECDNLQKGFGLNPNAPVTKSAMKNMAHTNQFTDLFLLPQENEANHLELEVSPLVRPLQTASKLVPKSVSNINVHLNTAIKENSSSPSGMDIMSNEELENTGKKGTSGFKRFLFSVSRFFQRMGDEIRRLFGKPTLFQTREEQKQNAIQTITENRSGKLTEDRDSGPTENRSDSEKLEQTKSDMLTHMASDHKNTWFIGHGRNFKTLFREALGHKDSFAYAETRRLYRIQEQENSEGEMLYCPPYRLIIDQKTGLLKTSCYDTPLNKPIKLESNDKLIARAKKGNPSLHKLGPSVSDPLKSDINDTCRSHLKDEPLSRSQGKRHLINKKTEKEEKPSDHISPQL